MKIVITGAPGSGKGSRTPILEKIYGIPTISTGNILRVEVQAGTELGLKAKGIMDSGGLVSDEIIIGILANRVKQADCEDGFILDGVPRTLVQAEMMENEGIEIDKVLEVYVPDEILVDRLSGRRVCETCGATFHIIDKPPVKEGICDVDGKELIIRKDDTPEVIGARIKAYHEQTEPIIDFYKGKGVSFAKIDANKPFEMAESAVREALNEGASPLRNEVRR